MCAMTWVRIGVTSLRSVEYKGSVAAEDYASLMAELQAALDALIAEDIETDVTQLPFCEIDPLYLNTGFPDTGELIRVVGVGGGPRCPCGGTHVRSSGDLQGAVITRVKTKKKVTKISYDLVA